MQGGPRLLVLLGSSGSGKSSLLRAGVLPVLRPQTRPLESLAQSLAIALQRSNAWRELHQQLQAPSEVADLSALFSGWVSDLRMAANSPEAQILLPIDQGEELFTLADVAERERLTAVLATLLQQTLPVQVVITIRADAMGSLQAMPQLVNGLETMPLGPLSLAHYRQIIEGPARVAGFRVEEAFVDRAIHDTATEDALLLLAFALGVITSLRPEATSLLALRDAFVPAMVQVSEQGSYARRAAVWESLPEAAHPLLDALVAARLLVRRQKEGEPSTVEVAHEVLLRVWPLLRRWLDDSRDFLIGSQQLEQDLAQWQAASPADKPRALLTGLKLAKGRAWLAERSPQLRTELRDFIQTSMHALCVSVKSCRMGLAAVWPWCQWPC